MHVKFKIKDIQLDKASFEHLAKMIGETKETLIFNGRYAIIREFGVSATTLDDETIAEFTKDYMDSGLTHAEAYKMATLFAEEISKNGFNSMPFLRPAIDDVISRHKDDMLDIGQIGEIVNEILLEAITNFERDSQKTNFNLPIDVDVVKG